MLIAIETILLIVALSGWILAYRRKDPSDVTQAVNDLRAAKKEVEMVRKALSDACNRVDVLSQIQKAQIEQVNASIILSGYGRDLKKIPYNNIDAIIPEQVPYDEIVIQDTQKNTPPGYNI